MKMKSYENNAAIKSNDGYVFIIQRGLVSYHVVQLDGVSQVRLNEWECKSRKEATELAEELAA
jgi:hypothetical protein